MLVDRLGFAQHVIGLFVILCGLLLSFPGWASATPDGWQPVTDPAATVSQSRPLFDRRNRSFQTTVTVTNGGATALPQALRLVIVESNMPALAPDGSAVAGEPYYLLSVLAGGLQPGASPSLTA